MRLRSASSAYQINILYKTLVSLKLNGLLSSIQNHHPFPATSLPLTPAPGDDHIPPPLSATTLPQ